MHPTMASRFDALEQTWSSLQSVLVELAPDEWALPTGCPGWSVKDNVSHIAGLERSILGEPDPEHHLPEDMPHVRDENGRFTEMAVDYRRPWPNKRVLAEFEDVTARRLEMLRADETPPDKDVAGPFGWRLPYSRLMTIRVFDCYAHEQDVRRATHRYGNAVGPAADIARKNIVTGWSRIARNLRELDGVHVVLVLDGSQHDLSHPDGATREVRLTTDLLAAVPLACGRDDRRVEAVSVEGSSDLWESLLPHLGFTP
ncbi:MAG: maleylpyruvate isomerase family mycothiol-dependent enzyme [Acidimicrobiales bacterium]